MPELEKKSFNGGLNSDDSDFLIGAQDYRNAINVRNVATDNSKLGSVQNVRGNALVGSKIATLTGKTGDFHTIGSFEDETNECIYDLVYNSVGHHLLMKRDKTGSTVLLDNDKFSTAGTNTGLNLTRTELVTAMAMVGDTLYWGNGIPRRINVSRLLSGQYDSDFDDDLISLIRRPPNLPPTFTRQTIGTSLTMIREGAFQFAWRFMYYDGETSVFSPYSLLADYGAENDNSNALVVALPSDNPIKQDVRFVELAVRAGNTGDFFIIKRWDKDNATDAAAITEHNAGGGLTYDFYNDSIGEAVPEADGVKPFENIPLITEAITAAENRIFLGNNKVGYDTPAGSDIALTTNKVTIEAGSQTITGRWHWIQEKHLSGLNPEYAKAWMLYIAGYDGFPKGDGYYAVKDVEGSESARHSHNPTPDSWFSFPDPVQYDDLDFIGTSQNDLKAYYGLSPHGTRQISEGWSDHTDSTIVGAPETNDFKPVTVFKSNAIYRFGKVFYDRYMRSSAVVTTEDDKISTPGISYDNTSYTNRINWAVSNDNAKDEIPEWAEFYSIVMTKCLRTRFFMQTYPYSVTYAVKNGDTYDTALSDYSDTYAGIAISLSSLIKDNLGYVFNKGDIVDIYLPDAINGTKHYSLPVIDQFGEYIVTKLVDLGDLTSTINLFIELYTPYKAAAIEPYYEVGHIYPISDPGSDARTFSVTSGFVEGDTWVVARKHSSVSTNGVEAMNPNDKHYSEWLTNAGRPNTVPQPGIGQATKETNIVFSNQYLPGTLINGLSSFDSPNTKDLPDGCGPIKKLVYTSKVEGQQGAVMLAICENETASIYIGETRVETQTGESFLAASPGVIGTVNILKGSFGTIHPESVAQNDGHVYFLCMKRGLVIQYATNGLYPISDFKMHEFFKNRCSDLQNLTDDQLTEFGYDGIFCPGGYDRQHNEYLLSLPRTKELPDFLEDITRNTFTFANGTSDTVLSKLGFYKGTITSETLTAMVTVSYDGVTLVDNEALVDGKLDISAFRPKSTGGKITVTSENDVSLSIFVLQPNYHESDCGQEMVMAYKITANRWIEKFFYQPESIRSIGKSLYTFLSGDFYQHNTGDYDTFYGEKCPSILAFVANEQAVSPRIFNGIKLHGSVAPDYLHIRTEGEYAGGSYHQSSDLIKSEFKYLEGIIAAPFWYDRLSPNTSGSYDEKMMKGDQMRAQTAAILLEYDIYDQPVELKAAEINFKVSIGHIL